MSNNDAIHIGDIGTVIEITVKENDAPLNLSDATVKKFVFRKATGTAVEKTASFSTDGSNGKLRYVTIANDIDAAGRWTLQVYIETPGGKWHTDEIAFRVLENIS